MPIYYNPEIVEQLAGLRKDYDLVRFGDLVETGVVSVSTGDEVGKLAYGTGQIPFIRTSDIANWEIKIDPKQGLSEELYNALKEKQDVQAHDILMVKDGTYLVGTCAMVSESDTKIVFQSHLYKIRCIDHEKVNPWLLLALLSCPIVKQQIRSKQFNTLHFASQSRVPNGALPPWDTPTTNRRYAPCWEHSAVCCQQPVSRSACSSL